MRQRGCITSSQFTMLVDIKSEVVVQDKLSGSIQKTFVLTDPNQKCKAVSAAGDKSLNVSTQTFGELYNEDDWVAVIVGPSVNVSKSSQVTNIRDANGTVVWEEEDGDPTVFNVLGIVPKMNPFGVVVEKKLIVNRAESQ